MTSAVVTTFPADTVKVSKATMRNQFLVIYNEITALQSRTGAAGASAFWAYVEEDDMKNYVRSQLKKATQTYAQDIAFGRIADALV